MAGIPRRMQHLNLAHLFISAGAGRGRHRCHRWRRRRCAVVFAFISASFRLFSSGLCLFRRFDAAALMNGLKSAPRRNWFSSVWCSFLLVYLEPILIRFQPNFDGLIELDASVEYWLWFSILLASFLIVQVRFNFNFLFLIDWHFPFRLVESDWLIHGYCPPMFGFRSKILLLTIWQFSCHVRPNFSPVSSERNTHTHRERERETGSDETFYKSWLSARRFGHLDLINADGGCHWLK